MPETIVLFKKLPDADYLVRLYEEGKARATMGFLPGGCYAGAALFSEPGPYSTRSSTVAVQGACPPDDPINCTLAEFWAIVRKVSPVKPLDFNAFLFVEVMAGSSGEFMEIVREVGGPDDGTTDYVVTDQGREYIAAAHLIGCSSYNVLVEVLAESHERLFEVVHRLTDQRFVKQYAVGRLAAEAARGFGEAYAARAAGAAG